MHDICWEVALQVKRAKKLDQWLFILSCCRLRVPISMTPNIIIKEGGSAFIHVLVHSSMKERPPLLAASSCKIFERWPKV